MSNVIIVRINLDAYSVQELTRFVETRLITRSEARTASAVQKLSEYDQIMLVRRWQKQYDSPVRLVG